MPSNIISNLQFHLPPFGPAAPQRESLAASESNPASLNSISSAPTRPLYGREGSRFALRLIRQHPWRGTTGSFEAASGYANHTGPYTRLGPNPMTLPHPPLMDSAHSDYESEAGSRMSVGRHQWDYDQYQPSRAGGAPSEYGSDASSYMSRGPRQWDYDEYPLRPTDAAPVNYESDTASYTSTSSRARSVPHDPDVEPPPEMEGSSLYEFDDTGSQRTRFSSFLEEEPDRFVSSLHEEPETASLHEPAPGRANSVLEQQDPLRQETFDSGYASMRSEQRLKHAQPRTESVQDVEDVRVSRRSDASHANSHMITPDKDDLETIPDMDSIMMAPRESSIDIPPALDEHIPSRESRVPRRQKDAPRKETFDSGHKPELSGMKLKLAQLRPKPGLHVVQALSRRSNDANSRASVDLVMNVPHETRLDTPLPPAMHHQPLPTALHHIREACAPEGGIRDIAHRAGVNDADTIQALVEVERAGVVDAEMTQALTDALRANDAEAIEYLRGQMQYIVDPDRRKEIVLAAAEEFPAAVAKGFRETAGEFHRMLIDSTTTGEREHIMQKSADWLAVGFGAALNRGNSAGIKTLRTVESELSIPPQPEHLRQTADGLANAVRGGHADAIGEFAPVFDRAHGEAWYRQTIVEASRQLAQTPPERLGETIRELTRFAAGRHGDHLELVMMAMIDALPSSGKAGAGEAMKALADALGQQAHRLDSRSRARLLARIETRTGSHGKYRPANLWKMLKFKSAHQEFSGALKDVRKLLKS